MRTIDNSVEWNYLVEDVKKGLVKDCMMFSDGILNYKEGRLIIWAGYPIYFKGFSTSPEVFDGNRGILLYDPDTRVLS